MSNRPEHWNAVYARRAPTEVSWYQRDATPSLDAIAACHVAPTAPIVDVGAGASTLVDGLLARGFDDVTLLDVSEGALAETRRRLLEGGPKHVAYVVADVIQWGPPRTFGLWHDRAVFHFLIDERERVLYRNVVASALPRGAHAIIATFAPDGPERCSGLLVRRYSAESLAEEFTGVLRLEDSKPVTHTTPGAALQSFVFAHFVRV
jgi:trans-aconitate methyltransferase